MRITAAAVALILTGCGSTLEAPPLPELALAIEPTPVPFSPLPCRERLCGDPADCCRLTAWWAAPSLYVVEASGRSWVIERIEAETVDASGRHLGTQVWEHDEIETSGVVSFRYSARIVPHGGMQAHLTIGFAAEAAPPSPGEVRVRVQAVDDGGRRVTVAVEAPLTIW